MIPLVQPHLWDGPSKLQARVGSKVTISFSVAGNPEPTVIWEHEDVEIAPSRSHVVKTSGGVTSVCVTDVKREDEGVYLCTALNGLGSVGQECHLTVLGETTATAVTSLSCVASLE